MEQGPTEDMIIQQCVMQGLHRIPEAIKNAPELREDLEFFYQAFWDLNTTRSIAMSEGPIPWTAVHIYAEYNELDREEEEELHYHISRLDHCYRKHQESKHG